MTKIFNVPFALEGDKISPPDAVQSDGSVSYTLGYGFDYQRDTGVDEGGAPIDPLAKVFPREQHNGILNDITTAIGEIQLNGLSVWQSAAAPYPINAMVRYGNSNWRSTIASNTTTPGSAGASWVDYAYQPQATETIIGVSLVATQQKVNAGADDSSFVSPKKLAAWLPLNVLQATEARSGIAKLSTEAIARSGADDTTIMTPLKVKFATESKITGDGCYMGGFASNNADRPYLLHQSSGLGVFLATASSLAALLPKRSFGINDYIRIPDVPGGLIIQWGSAPYNDIPGGAVVQLPITYPVRFPNAPIAVYGMARNSQGSVIVNERSGTNTGTVLTVFEANTGVFPGLVYWLAIGN